MIPLFVDKCIQPGCFINETGVNACWQLRIIICKSCSGNRIQVFTIINRSSLPCRICFSASFSSAFHAVPRGLGRLLTNTSQKTEESWRFMLSVIYGTGPEELEWTRGERRRGEGLSRSKKSRIDNEVKQGRLLKCKAKTRHSIPLA